MNTEIILLCKLASCASAKKFDQLPGIFSDLKQIDSNPDHIYETLLQIYLFNGFPATLESLKLFKEHFSNYAPPKEQYNVNLFEKRGIINCKQVYSSNFDKLQQNIGSFSPDLADWMLIEGYGKVMGRPGLPMQTRELLNVAMLSTNYAEHQLYSHIKGSFNTGSDYNTIKQVIEVTNEYNTAENLKKSLEMLKKVKSTVQTQ